MAQRRLRALGMLGAIGRDRPQVRLVMLANGAAVGVVGGDRRHGARSGGVVRASSRRFDHLVGHRIDPLDLPWWAVVADAMLLRVSPRSAAAWWPARPVARTPIVAALVGASGPDRSRPTGSPLLGGVLLAAAASCCSSCAAQRQHPCLIVSGIARDRGRHAASWRRSASAASPLLRRAARRSRFGWRCAISPGTRPAPGQPSLRPARGRHCRDDRDQRGRRRRQITASVGGQPPAESAHRLGDRQPGDGGGSGRQPSLQPGPASSTVTGDIEPGWRSAIARQHGCTRSGVRPVGCAARPRTQRRVQPASDGVQPGVTAGGRAGYRLSRWPESPGWPMEGMSRCVATPSTWPPRRCSNSIGIPASADRAERVTSSPRAPT